MKIAIFGRITDNTDFVVLREFFTFLEEEEIPTLIYKPYAEKLAGYLLDFPLSHITTFDTAEEISDRKFIYCFGGDGTVLEAVRKLGQTNIPILGVNFGRLGYLASITQTELISATRNLQKDNYKLDYRSLISVISDPPGLFGENKFGINDLTIHKRNTNEMITVHTYLNGEFLNSYWGDGLVLATPTGSTAYSLSCGGPIIFPKSRTFAITPVASHSLTVRPIVIPDDWVVSFEISSRSGEAMVALDNRTEPVKAGTSIAIKRAPFQISLVRMQATKHIDNLRKSLMWGRDQRNN